MHILLLDKMYGRTVIISKKNEPTTAFNFCLTGLFSRY